MKHKEPVPVWKRITLIAVAVWVIGGLSWFATPQMKGVMSIVFPPEYTAGREIILPAGAHSGHDDLWTRRPSAGKMSWGIRGSGYPESGAMGFDGFPGDSGHYRIELGAVLERDGSPEYRVSVGGQVVGEGRYDFACGVLMCNASRAECPDAAVHLDLGTHPIRRGDRIEVWGRSTYPCGEHGAYTRWYELRFTPLDDVSGAPERLGAGISPRSSPAW